MAFRPNFKYTAKIVNNLTETASAREVILNAHLVPKWEVRLCREALIKNTHHSTSIEGNPLSMEEVSDLAAGRKVMATRKARAEVLNYLHVLEHISDFTKEGMIREKDLLRMHKALTKGTLDRPEDSGKYRNRQVVVGNRITGEVVFMPPKTEEVPGLVRGRKTFLTFRRRRWQIEGQDKLLKRDIKLTAEGTTLEKEFAEFLKK